MKNYKYFWLLLLGAIMTIFAFSSCKKADTDATTPKFTMHTSNSAT